MADNSLQGGSDTIRDKDRAGVKTQVFGSDLNIGGATEVLQTAVVAADATANPTVPGYLAYNLGWNGATWDRLKSSAANGLQVDVTRSAPDATATGALSAAGTNVALALSGQSSGLITLAGIWAGTIAFEGFDGATWFPINGVSSSTSTPSPTTVVNGAYRITPAGFSSIRANMTAFTSGSATVVLRAAVGTGGVFANQILPMKLTDGVSIQTIKPASTAAVAADQAAVVALHPSSPTPPGAAIIGKVGIDQTTPGTTNAVAFSNTTIAVTNAGTFAAQCTLAAETTKVIGTVNVAASQTIGLVAGSATIGALTANQTVNVAQTNGVAPLMGNGVSGTGSQRVTIASDNTAFPVNATVTNAALTKGTQGATGVTTQDLKDAGRVNVAMTCYQAPGIITTEALFAAATFAISRDGAAATTGQQLAVTAGKRLRLQSIVVGIKNTAAAAGTSKLVLRYAAAGGVIATTSPILAILDLGSNSAVAAAYIGPTEMALPDGVELLPASTFGFTSLCSAATMLHTITVTGFEF